MCIQTRGLIRHFGTFYLHLLYPHPSGRVVTIALPHSVLYPFVFLSLQNLSNKNQGLPDY